MEADFTTPAGAPFTARLTWFDGKKLEQFDLANEQDALRAKQRVESGKFHVGSVEKKRVKRNPYAPFTTSTLQQEASRKLGFGAQQTMRLAQQLYEGVDIGGETTGLITYMRTDGVQMAREAIAAIRDHVAASYGDTYLPSAPREYQSKIKNAQEAHEAIRPTDVARTPDSIAAYVSSDQRRLYELIWKRAVASQMQSAELDQVAVDVTDGKGTTLRATGSVIAFDGFLKLYREDTDDAAEEDDSRMLPPMAERDPLGLGEVTAEQHFTQPPPRFSEASLVKKMEELGIGRPSTYASILSVLQDRKYVRLEKRRFIPEDRGRLVTAFLVSFFEHYVDTGFTASMEEQLDDIAGGNAEWRAMLHTFWDEFSRAVDQTKDLKISDVIAALDQDLGPHFFPPREDGTDPRACQACGTGRLGLKLGRYGSFIGCSNYPNCQYTRRLAIENGEDQGETLKEGMRALGHHPDTGEDITVRRGPYGLYAQQGENGEDKKHKPRRTALPRGMDGDQITLEQALGLLSLPREIGLHPGDRRGDPGRHRPVRSLCADGRDLWLARSRRRRAGDRHQSGGGPDRAQDGERADGRHPSGGQGTDRGAQGPLRPLRAARQDGGQPAARRDDGGDHAGPGGGAAGREGQAVAPAWRGGTARTHRRRGEAGTRRDATGRQGVGQGKGQTGQATGPEGQTRSAEAGGETVSRRQDRPRKRRRRQSGKKAAAATAGRQRV